MIDALTKDEIHSIEEYYDLSNGQEPLLSIWIIGRPAAGKTTTAILLKEVLKKAGRRVELIDGDAVRSILNGNLGYSPNERLLVFKKYVHISQLLQSRGIIPITATICGLLEFRNIVRSNLINPRFVYLDCPFEIAAQRDQKGNYTKALSGQLKNFFGVDIPFEIPKDCEITIDSARLKPAEIVVKIIEHLDKYGF